MFCFVCIWVPFCNVLFIGAAPPTFGLEAEQQNPQASATNRQAAGHSAKDIGRVARQVSHFSEIVAIC